MVFSSIQGQDTAVQTLTRALESKRLHHAYLFDGPPGVGKEMAAFALAQSLVCETSDGVGCGKCNACKRAVSLDENEPHVPRHPDVVLVGRALYSPQMLGTTRSEVTGIGVEQIRRVVLSRAGFRPHEARSLVFIVRNAHELTQSAANALLKTLEEPEPWVHFVLVTHRPSELFDTIRSRTLTIRFRPLSDSVISGILERKGLPTQSVALARGSVELALELADPERVAAREAFIEAFDAALSADTLGDALSISEHVEDRANLAAKLETAASFLADRARSDVGAGARLASQLATRYAAVLEARFNLEQNAQPALLLEALIGRLRRV
jgi:DNA polymerase III subunit delta'